MDRFLAVEVIKDVGLGQARRLGDLVQRGTAESVLRKDVQRRVEDDAAIAQLNAAGLFRYRFGSGLRHRPLRS